MDVFDYIAGSTPAIAKGIVQHFGYTTNSNSSSELAQDLRQVVNQEGESAVDIIMKNHPDRDYFEEMFASGKDNHGDNCDCVECKLEKLKKEFLNADGSSQVTQAKQVENNFSLIFLAGVTMLSIAILSYKK